MKYTIRRRKGLWQVYYGKTFLGWFHYYNSCWGFIKRRELLRRKVKW